MIASVYSWTGTMVMVCGWTSTVPRAWLMFARNRVSHCENTDLQFASIFFSAKHDLLVHVRTASRRWFRRVHTSYDLEQNNNEKCKRL